MQETTEGIERVVVEVDGSERNLAALSWAKADAVRRDRPLHLVAVACKSTMPPAPWTEDSTIQYSPDETERMVDRTRRRCGTEVPSAATTLVVVHAWEEPAPSLWQAITPGTGPSGQRRRFSSGWTRGSDASPTSTWRASLLRPTRAGPSSTPRSTPRWWWSGVSRACTTCWASPGSRPAARSCITPPARSASYRSRRGRTNRSSTRPTSPSSEGRRACRTGSGDPPTPGGRERG